MGLLGRPLIAGRRAAAGTAGGCWPTPSQVLLLRAALLGTGEAVAAWERWRATTDLDSVDEPSYRLLPLLWYNLSRLGVQDPALDRCRGVFRHTWSKNQLLFHHAGRVLQELARTGTPVLVLKGAAMATAYLPSLGARPMNDVDIMVPTREAEPARALLERLGWTPSLELPASSLPFIHAMGYRHSSGAMLDLHWHALWEGTGAGADEAFWAAATPLELAGVPVLTLAPADHLVQVAVHGLRFSPVPPIHWVADAWHVMGRVGDGMDWARVLHHAERGRLGLQLAEALGFLSDALGAAIPASVLRAVRALPAGPAERIELWARMRPPALGRGLLLHWFDYRRRLPDTGAARRALGFPVYLRTIWGLRGVWQLPTVAAGKIVRRTLLRGGSPRS